MGPYCNFCGRRCFCYFPEKTPLHILKAYGTSNIIATCAEGQKFEKERVGYCYDEIMKAIAEADAIAPEAESKSEEENPYLLTGEELERAEKRRKAGINW